MDWIYIALTTLPFHNFFILLLLIFWIFLSLLLILLLLVFELTTKSYKYCWPSMLVLLTCSGAACSLPNNSSSFSSILSSYIKGSFIISISAFLIVCFFSRFVHMCCPLARYYIISFCLSTIYRTDFFQSDNMGHMHTHTKSTQHRITKVNLLSASLFLFFCCPCVVLCLLSCNTKIEKANSVKDSFFSTQV